MRDRGRPVRLGLMAPLTGIVGLYGNEISWAGEIALQIVNERGGVLDRRVELVIEDDGSVPATAVPAAERLLDRHGCAALIGNLLSSSRIAVASRVTSRRRVPYLNFSFYEGSIGDPYFFHFAALPNQQIDKMIPFMAETVGPKMYFAGHDYEWPRGSIDAAKQALVRAGGEVIGEEYFAMGSDFTPLMERLAISGADVFVPYFAGADQQKLLTLFTRRNVKRQMQVVMGHYDEAMVSELPPDVREGFYSSNTYFMSLPTAENVDYLERLARHPGVNGVWPHGNGVLTNFGEGTYLCVLAWAKAVNRAGSLDPDAVVEALSTVEVTGPQGRVVMDPRTRHAAVNTYLARCNRDGTFAIVRSFGRVAPEIPERYRARFDVGELSTFHDEKAWRLGARLGPDAPLPAMLQSHLADRPSSETEGNVRSDVLVTLDELSPGTRVVLVRGELAHLGAFIDPISRSASLGELLVLGDGAVAFANDTIATLAGFPNTNACIGRHAASFWSIELPWSIMERASDAIDVWIGDARMLHVSGAPVPCRVALKPLRDRDGHAVAHSVLACRSDDAAAVDALTSRATATTSTAVLRTAPKTGFIVDANDAATKLLRWPRSELVNLTIDEVFSPAYRKLEGARVRALGRACSRPTIVIPHETAAYRKDGTEFVAQTAFSSIETTSGDEILVALRDIDDERHQRQLRTWRASHDPLTMLPNAALIQERVNNALARSKATGLQVGVLFLEIGVLGLAGDLPDDVIRAVACRIGGALRAGDTAGRTGPSEFTIVCDRIQNEEELRHRGEGIVNAVEAPFETASELGTVRVSMTPVLGRGSALEALRAVGRQLRSTEERYRSLVESSPYGIVECDRRGIITLANAAYARMHGVEGTGKCIGSAIWERAEQGIVAEQLRSSVAAWMTGERCPSRQVVRELRVDGRPIDVQIDADYERAPSGVPTGLVAVVTDVTEQIRAARELSQLNASLEARVRERTQELEELTRTLKANLAEREVIERQLRASDERFRGIFEQTADGILLVDEAQRIFDTNPAILRLLGFDREELLGADVGGLAEDARSDFGARFREMSCGNADSFIGEFRFKRKADAPVWVCARVGNVRDTRHKFLLAFVIAQDISNAKALEEQRALVTLELDHRVKNNLAAIGALFDQSAKSCMTKAELIVSFQGRLQGVARIHEMLADNSWGEMSLRKMLEAIVKPFSTPISRFSARGPEITIPATTAMPFGMVVSELILNSAKHGALAHAGRTDVEWHVDSSTRRLVLNWREEMPQPVTPGKSGTGTRIICGLVRHELGGDARLDLEPCGVRWQLAIPLGTLANTGAGRTAPPPKRDSA